MNYRKYKGHIAFLLFGFLLAGCQGFFKKSTQPQVADHPVVVNPNEQQTTNHPGDVVHVPEFIAEKAPRVGVIFGPGGAKVLAEIGALQELERQKIPVVATVGLEWGALVGALYSLNGQSHEVDWKISQLPKVSFSSSNLFSKKMQPTTISEYDKYLAKVFASERVESTKLPFACPYIKRESSRSALVKKGALRNVLKSCWQYPPLFAEAQSLAAPYALADAVSYLKKNGAELIVLINVLENPSEKDFASWDDTSWVWFSWVPVHVALRSASGFGIQETIQIDTSAFDMADFDQRLRLIQVGKQGAASQIERLIKKYDF
ncbi:MAG: hypothetical protein H6623_03100 [Bdellovibrionaceae bacterium]|nr:hypothetical protein [Pseudobdellovibrionaceae bacterium]